MKNWKNYKVVNKEQTKNDISKSLILHVILGAESTYLVKNTLLCEYSLGMRNFALILFLFISLPSRASFLVDLSFNYHDDTDDVTTFAYSRFDYRGFLGASLDNKEKFFFGQNISQFGREFQDNGATGNYSVLELGPRFQYYIDSSQNFYISAAWNPYVQGERKVSGVTVDISGSSYFAAFGWQLKLSRSLFLGASINYHSISITKETDTDNVETEVTNAYTTIYPMIEISFRFR